MLPKSHACMSCVCSVSVCGSMYELISGLPESEMPYHFYTDQHFALVLLCLLLILPLSIPKEISIQKYIRSAYPGLSDVFDHLHDLESKT